MSWIFKKWKFSENRTWAFIINWAILPCSTILIKIFIIVSYLEKGTHNLLQAFSNSYFWNVMLNYTYIPCNLQNTGLLPIYFKENRFNSEFIPESFSLFPPKSNLFIKTLLIRCFNRAFSSLCHSTKWIPHPHRWVVSKTDECSNHHLDGFIWWSEWISIS